MAVSGADIVKYLMQFRGTKYVWGGNSLTGGIDCSGLIQQGMAHFGISVGRVTNDQIGQGKSVDLDHLQIGDAVFFDTEPGRSGPDHVGIYIGNGKMLHAPHTGDVVKVTDITSGYWTSKFMGGRRFSGVEGGGDANTDWATQGETERKLSPEEMAANYGLAYAFLKSDPSISKLFDQAVKENWTDTMFQARFKASDWYQQNSESMRKAKEMKASDPATWSATIDANKVKIQQMAAQLGAVVPDKALGQMAEDMQMQGMTDERLQQVLGGYVDYVDGSLTGRAGQFEHQMRQYSYSMGVDMNQQSIKNYAQLMVKGLATQDDFKNFIDNQAVSTYPGYEEQIKAGMTMKDIANPYIQMMSSHLEMDPNSITLKDPLITGALNGLDANGNPAGQSMTEFEGTLRGDPRWRQTQQAQNQAMNMGLGVLKNWGLISG